MWFSPGRICFKPILSEVFVPTGYGLPMIAFLTSESWPVSRGYGRDDAGDVQRRDRGVFVLAPRPAGPSVQCLCRRPRLTPVRRFGRTRARTFEHLPWSPLEGLSAPALSPSPYQPSACSGRSGLVSKLSLEVRFKPRRSVRALHIDRYTRHTAPKSSRKSNGKRDLAHDS